MRKSLTLCVMLAAALTLVGCSKKTPPPAPAPAPVDQDVPIPVTPTPVEPTPVEPAVSEDPNAPVVTVNGKVITVAMIEEKIAPQITGNPALDPNNNPQAADLRQRIYDQTVQTFIIETILAPRIADANIVVTDAEVTAELENFAQTRGMTIEQLRAFALQTGQTFEGMQDQARQLLTYVKLARHADPNATVVTDAEAKAYYDANKLRFSTPEQVRASHILIKVDEGDDEAVKEQKRAKIEELLKQVNDGGDFAALATAHSECPSASKGGDLDFFGKGQMVPPFEQAAWALEKGQVSDVVETQFGYHIIKATDRRAAATTPFEEVKTDVMAFLESSKERTMLRDYINKAMSEASIIYPPGKQPVTPIPQ